MAYETGTATNHRDLLAKVRDFLTTNADLVADGQEWEVVGGAASGTPATNGYVSFKAPGLGGTDEIFMSIQVREIPGNNAYNLRLIGHVSYDELTPTPTPPGSNFGSDMLLGNSPVTYWIVANGRRFILVVKFNVQYEWMYGGFILPSHLPDEWSYPLFTGASAAPSDLINTLTDSRHTAFWQGYANNNLPDQAATGYLWCPSNEWRPVRNTGNTVELPSTTAEGGLQTRQWGIHAFSNLRRSIDGNPWFTRGEIVSVGSPANSNGSTSGEVTAVAPDGGAMYGVFDGVFFTTAFGATAEQTAVEGGVTYMMFPNVYRVDNKMFAAIALE